MTTPAVEVRNLTFHYADGRMALHHVSFAIQEGESVGLVGPNGAGKSTLLWHLNGILPGRAQYEHHHAQGHTHSHRGEPRVWIAGLPVSDENLPEIRRRVGVLFQDPDDQLFCPTVLDDVAFGPRNLGLSADAARERALQCLDQVALAGFGDRLPHHLSVGERKRVCLAAILACEPSILALDEPSGSLDPATRRQFMGLVGSLTATRIVATHDLELVLALCDRVLLLDRGELHADGPARDILSDEPLLARHALEVPLSIRLAHDGNGGAPSHGPRLFSATEHDE